MSNISTYSPYTEASGHTKQFDFSIVLTQQMEHRADATQASFVLPHRFDVTKCFVTTDLENGTAHPTSLSRK